MQKSNYILADARWCGHNGIGRFSTEILSRLNNTSYLSGETQPLSIKNLISLPLQLQKNKNKFKVFFSPGFNPILHCPTPYVFSIHDLIHLLIPSKTRLFKKMYYDTLIKPTAKKAEMILTGSEYSKLSILRWLNIKPEKLKVINYGISGFFTPHGRKMQINFPYLLHVGSTKAHKNISRLLNAFSRSKIPKEFLLLLTGDKTPHLMKIIEKNKLTHRVLFIGALTEESLAEYYRGATAVVFPSLFEGFGLPVAEGMACGTPVLTSNVSSLPEVAGNAAVLVDPYDMDSLCLGLEKIVLDDRLRSELILRGLERAKIFSWDKTARQIQSILDGIVRTGSGVDVLT